MRITRWMERTWTSNVAVSRDIHSFASLRALCIFTLLFNFNLLICSRFVRIHYTHPRTLIPHTEQHSSVSALCGFLVLFLLFSFHQNKLGWAKRCIRKSFRIICREQFTRCIISLADVGSSSNWLLAVMLVHHLVKAYTRMCVLCGAMYRMHIHLFMWKPVNAIHILHRRTSVC